MNDNDRAEFVRTYMSEDFQKWKEEGHKGGIRQYVKVHRGAITLTAQQTSKDEQSECRDAYYMMGRGGTGPAGGMGGPYGM